MTLQERLRDPAHGFDRNESHTEDRYVCLCEHLANEAADALDAQDARIKELEWLLSEAMEFVESDYTGTRNKDLTGSNLIHRAREALK